MPNGIMITSKAEKADCWPIVSPEDNSDGTDGECWTVSASQGHPRSI